MVTPPAVHLFTPQAARARDQLQRAPANQGIANSTRSSYRRTQSLIESTSELQTPENLHTILEPSPGVKVTEWNPGNASSSGNTIW